MNAVVNAYVGEDVFVKTIRASTELAFGMNLLAWIKSLPEKPRKLEIDFI